MKIISAKECNRIDAESISMYPDAIRLTSIYTTWKKLYPFIISTVTILSAILAYFSHIRSLILDYWGLQDLSLLLGALFTVIFALLVFLVMTIIHEFIHLLGYIKDFRDCYLILSKKAVSVYNSKWVTKRNLLIDLILPFLFFLVVAGIISILTKNIYLFYWITLFNLGGASSDIVVFFVVLFKAPKNSLILGHYYRIP